MALRERKYMKQIIGGRSPIISILAGIILFLVISLCWGFLAALIGWLANLDPSEAWWQKIGYFAVFFLPEPIFAYASAYIAGRMSSAYVFRVTLCITLALTIIGFTMLAILYPYE